MGIISSIMLVLVFYLLTERKQPVKVRVEQRKEHPRRRGVKQ